MKKFTSKTQKIGKLGENVTCKYLLNNGFNVLERNFTRKWGEIDIIAKKSNIIHFIEVKSVSRENLPFHSADISRETNRSDQYRPEDQMHSWKQKRLIRTIQTYLELHEVGEWQFDVVCIYLDFERRKARIKVMNDLILA